MILLFVTLLPKYFYNIRDTITIEGKVKDVFVDRVEGYNVDYLAMELETTDSSSYKVLLGPPWFLKKLPRKGKTCVVHGALFQEGDLKFIIARWYTLQGDKRRFELRSINGFPLWRREGSGFRFRGGGRSDSQGNLRK